MLLFLPVIISAEETYVEKQIKFNPEPGDEKTFPIRFRCVCIHRLRHSRAADKFQCRIKFRFSRADIGRESGCVRFVYERSDHRSIVEQFCC